MCLQSVCNYSHISFILGKGKRPCNGTAQYINYMAETNVSGFSLIVEHIIHTFFLGLLELPFNHHSQDSPLSLYIHILQHSAGCSSASTVSVPVGGILMYIPPPPTSSGSAPVLVKCTMLSNHCNLHKGKTWKELEVSWPAV